MKLGVDDYLLKHKLSRLGIVVERELRDAAERHARADAEQALRASQVRLQRLAESGIIGIIVADEAGKIVEANDAFLGMVGYSREDLENGRVSWDAMTPPEWAQLNDAATEQLRARGAAGLWEKEYLRKDGSRVPVLVGWQGSKVPRISLSRSTCPRASASRTSFVKLRRWKPWASSRAASLTTSTTCSP